MELFAGNDFFQVIRNNTILEFQSPTGESPQFERFYEAFFKGTFSNFCQFFRIFVESLEVFPDRLRSLAEHVSPFFIGKGFEYIDFAAVSAVFFEVISVIARFLRKFGT